MCRLIFIKLFLIVLTFYKQVLCITDPCPKFFKYRNDGLGIYGLITVPILRSYNNLIILKVQFTVGNKIGKYEGELQLVDSDAAALQIQNKQPVSMKLLFPVWHNIVPQITNITVNKNQICWGNPITFSDTRIYGSPYRTGTIVTVSLKHTLQLQSFNSNPNYNYNLPSSTKWNINYFTTSKPPLNKESVVFPNYQLPSTYNKSPRRPHIVWQNPIQTTSRPTISPARPFFNAPLTQPFSRICGLVAPTLSLIAHAAPAKKAEYPWLGALYKSGKRESSLLCGANLITNKHALTAGHCVKDKSDVNEFYLVLGREYIQHWLGEGVPIKVRNAIIHEDIKDMRGDGDLAILVLDKKVTFSPTISPVCLWNDDEDLNLLIGQNGDVVGWGEDENQNLVNKPKKTSVPIVSEEECLYSNAYFKTITSNRTFCAGYRNESGPCKGDSGSGFYIKKNQRWTIRGIVSQALAGPGNIGCDLTNYVVFVDVAKFRDWILRHIND